MDEPRQPRIEDPKLLLEMIKELGAAERHFNGTQAQYRAMASAWMLATFAGIGFLLTRSKELPLPVDVAIPLIAFAGAVGAFILWVMDLMVYHRLLHACFETARGLECAHPGLLPQTRSRMIETQHDGRVTYRVRWFYILLILAPMFLGGGLVAFIDPPSPTASTVFWVLAAVAVALCVVVFRRSAVSTEDDPRDA